MCRILLCIIAIWSVMFSVLVGTDIINHLLNMRFHLMWNNKMEKAKNAELRDQFKKLATTIAKTPKPFDTFVIHNKPVDEKQKRYLINWYNPPPFLKIRQDAFNCGFENCKYKNCNMTFDRKDRTQSDAVIFDGRLVPAKVGFVRPRGQVWIFAAHEAARTFRKHRGWQKPEWRYGFNWTMTYDKDITDIFLPYGEVRKYPKYVNRDYKALAVQKTQGALMISSHCKTTGLREKYVEQLSKYIPVEVLGTCGKSWNCGRQYVHNDCFNILNTTYKFFLAFENTFCNHYFTEKVFENFNYDIILVVRGGSFRQALSVFPKNTVISTDSFKTIEGLGKYLGKLSSSISVYADILKQKSQFYSQGYTAVYQRAMCDLCERMNNQDKYRKTIPDIVHWAYHKIPCKEATDLN